MAKSQIAFPEFNPSSVRRLNFEIPNLKIKSKSVQVLPKYTGVGNFNIKSKTTKNILRGHTDVFAVKAFFVTAFDCIFRIIKSISSKFRF